MAVPKPIPKTHDVTYDDYMLMPDDGQRYEVLEGELVLAPALDFEHQDVIWGLGTSLRMFVNSHRLGVVVGAPIDVVLSFNIIVQPDLLFIREDRRGIISGQVHGPPDLCVEALSPSTSRHDRNRKKVLYARYGVREYWIVDTDRETITVFTLRGNTYDEGIMLSGDDTLQASVIDDFAIRVREVFPS